MQANPSICSNEPSAASQSQFAQPTCPVCNGFLILQRGDFRCSRCQFTLCVGCEGGYVESCLATAD
jgi:hypothetical protein